MLNLDNIRYLNHVSCCCDTELGILGFTDDDDPATMCQSLVVGEEYSPDENCYWPVLQCQALINAEMLINNESCEWLSWYRYSHYKGVCNVYEDVNDVCDDELPF